uniref:Uncharacterized protein n=1 Tax=Palpitomonas bilix TaxID=652834 RepID=A0A7S3DAJ7_9EUKA
MNYYSVIGVLYTSIGGGSSLVIDGALQILASVTSSSSSSASPSSPSPSSSSSFTFAIPGTQPIDLHLAQGVLSLCVGIFFIITMMLRWFHSIRIHSQQKNRCAQSSPCMGSF